MAWITTSSVSLCALAACDGAAPCSSPYLPSRKPALYILSTPADPCTLEASAQLSLQHTIEPPPAGCDPFMHSPFSLRVSLWPAPEQFSTVPPAWPPRSSEPTGPAAIRMSCCRARTAERPVPAIRLVLISPLALRPLPFHSPVLLRSLIVCLSHRTASFEPFHLPRSPCLKTGGLDAEVFGSCPCLRFRQALHYAACLRILFYLRPPLLVAPASGASARGAAG